MWLKVLFFIVFISCVNHTTCRKLSIIGGQETSIFSFPFQCAFETFGRLRCGCSIISSKSALTAGHCVYNFKTNLTIRAGSTFRERGGTVYNITRFIIHPQFNMDNLNNDIAILKPNIDIKFDWVTTRPIALPAQDQRFNDGIGVVVSGWGKISTTSNIRPDRLQALAIRLINRNTCQNSYNNTRVTFKIIDTMICAGIMEGGKDSCSGDSGGPLITVSNRILVQIGIVSTGYGCALANYPGIYTNVAKFRSWIDLYLN